MLPAVQTGFQEQLGPRMDLHILLPWRIPCKVSTAKLTYSVVVQSQGSTRMKILQWLGQPAIQFYLPELAQISVNDQRSHTCIYFRPRLPVRQVTDEIFLTQQKHLLAQSVTKNTCSACPWGKLRLVGPLVQISFFGVPFLPYCEW